MDAIRNGDLDFGIVQSDIVYQASKGTGVFKDAKFSKLKSVMAIYPELLTLVTKKDANINNLLDIKGKRINLGNSGSKNETTTLTLFDESGIKKSDLKAGTYKGQNSDISTFGVKAVLVTNENVVYALVKAVLENFDEFKKLHPAYSNITKESLLEGLSAPLH